MVNKFLRQSFVLSIALAGSLGLSSASLALTAEERGLELAIQIDKRDSGFGDSVADLTMTLFNEAGDTAVRSLSIKTLEVNGDGNKTITNFSSPKDVRGTTLLTWSHDKADDDQWLYLPAISRVKRISSKNKSGPFMGSEFSYEDLASQEIGKYTYRYVREDTLDGVPVHVSERIPAYKNSGYSRQVTYVEKSTLNTLKVEFFDRGNKPLKTLIQTEYKQYPNGMWRTHKQHMVNHQSNKATTLKWDTYKFGNNYSDASFTKGRIKGSR